LTCSFLFFSFLFDGSLSSLLASCDFHFPQLQWYFAQVFGASFGLNRRAWFMFTPDFWGFEREEDRLLKELLTNTRTQQLHSQDRVHNEQLLSLKNQELRTYKLSKSYPQMTAVKVSAEEDEIFWLTVLKVPLRRFPLFTLLRLINLSFTLLLCRR
jgi:hypothetical protein